MSHSTNNCDETLIVDAFQEADAVLPSLIFFGNTYDYLRSITFGIHEQYSLRSLYKLAFGHEPSKLHDSSCDCESLKQVMYYFTSVYLEIICL